MELVTFLVDFILHVDRHLATFVQTYGPWVYGLLFAIVFVETGVVVMPFLPGDSLLFGTRVWSWEHSRLFNRRAFDQAHGFYERYGGVTIVIARFMPFIRTFAPFVAGVAEMNRARFTAFNVGGALLWVVGLTLAGYWFGNLAWVKANLSKIIWALVIVPGLLAIFGAWRARRAAMREAGIPGVRG